MALDILTKERIADGVLAELRADLSLDRKPELTTEIQGTPAAIEQDIKNYNDIITDVNSGVADNEKMAVEAQIISGLQQLAQTEGNDAVARLVDLVDNNDFKMRLSNEILGADKHLEDNENLKKTLLQRHGKSVVSGQDTPGDIDEAGVIGESQNIGDGILVDKVSPPEAGVAEEAVVVSAEAQPSTPLVAEKIITPATDEALTQKEVPPTKIVEKPAKLAEEKIVTETPVEVVEKQAPPVPEIIAPVDPDAEVSMDKLPWWEKVLKVGDGVTTDKIAGAGPNGPLVGVEDEKQ